MAAGGALALAIGGAGCFGDVYYNDLNHLPVRCIGLVIRGSY